MLEEEKNEKNTIAEKVKSLFSKIKNFEQLKYEIFEMRKIVEKTNEDISKIKEKYTNINDKMKDVNVFMNGSASFEHVQGDVEFRELTKKKLEDFDNKFKFVLGDFNFEGDEIIENVDKIKIIGKDKDKNKEEDKDKEKDIISSSSKKSGRRTYGEYKHVLLTDDQVSHLLKELGGAELERCIRYVDESAQKTGNKNGWKERPASMRRSSSIITSRRVGSSERLR